MAVGVVIRHGTKAQINAGCDCDSCRLTAFVIERRSLYRSITKIDAAPFAYVLDVALNSGIKISTIAERCGLSRSELTSIRYGQRELLWPETARKLRVGLLSFIPEEGDAATANP